MFKLKDLPGLFSIYRERFDEKLSELNELDSAVGDGDHGFTMSRTMQAAERAARRKFNDIGQGFDAVAEAMAENAGGAIGPLLASFFAEGGIVFKGMKEIRHQEFKVFLTNGLLAVQDIGGAKPGDKTLVDALAPAAEAAIGEDLETALQKAAAAARDGAEKTAQLTAVLGRASFAADRSVGHQDAGATSIALILETWLDYMQGTRSQKVLPMDTDAYQPPPGKLINLPVEMISEDNQGLSLLYPDLVRLTEDGLLLRSKLKEQGKVGIVIGHGGGHTPSMGGFVGPGLIDADVYGPVFTCASGLSIAKAIAAGDRGAGVVLLVSNHAGDVLNARLGVRRAHQQGVVVESVLMGDDIATAPRADFHKRRGLGGILFGLKIGGAAAEAGRPLQEVVDLVRKTNERTATLSVAVRPPTHPATGLPLFELPDGQIEIGTGVHGEVGVYRGPHLPADEIVDMLLERILSDLDSFNLENALVFINGAGGTSKMELHILYRRAFQEISDRGTKIIAGVAESYFTTQEMGGFSLSVCAVDQEMINLWNHPASSPCFRWPQN